MNSTALARMYNKESSSVVIIPNSTLRNRWDCRVCGSKRPSKFDTSCCSKCDSLMITSAYILQPFSDNASISTLSRESKNNKKNHQKLNLCQNELKIPITDI